MGWGFLKEDHCKMLSEFGMSVFFFFLHDTLSEFQWSVLNKEINATFLIPIPKVPNPVKLKTSSQSTRWVVSINYCQRFWRIG